jgi:hypothetical protein
VERNKVISKEQTIFYNSSNFNHEDLKLKLITVKEKVNFSLIFNIVFFLFKLKLYKITPNIL